MGCVATFDGKETGMGKEMGWRISLYEKWSERLKSTIEAWLLARKV